MIALYILSWLAVCYVSYRLINARAFRALKKLDDDDIAKRAEFRETIAHLTDRLWAVEQERDRAQAELAARIARRSEGSKRGAETRRARTQPVTVINPRGPFGLPPIQTGS